VGASNDEGEGVVFWLVGEVGLGVECLLEEGLVRLKGKTPRVPLGPLRSTSLSFVDSTSRSEPEPFRLGLDGEKPSLEEESFEGNRGANELLRAWTGTDGGSSVAVEKKASDVGEETLMEMPGSGDARPLSGGEEERDTLVTIVGKGCLAVLPAPGVLLSAGCNVALLLLLFLYSCTLC